MYRCIHAPQAAESYVYFIVWVGAHLHVHQTTMTGQPVPSLPDWRYCDSWAIHKMHSEDSDLTALMCRPIWDFAGFTCNVVGNAVARLMCIVCIIVYIKNPENCLTARKVYCGDCGQTVDCGFACMLHHVSMCLLTAYLSNRTMVFSCNSWAYTPRGWKSVFLPVNMKCIPGQKERDKPIGMYKPMHSISYKTACAPGRDSEQPTNTCRLIKVFAICLKRR